MVDIKNHNRYTVVDYDRTRYEDIHVDSLKLINGPPPSDRQPSCSICLEEFTGAVSAGRILFTPCGHVYHRSCLLGCRGRCPNCSVPLPSDVDVIPNACFIDGVKCYICREPVHQSMTLTYGPGIREFSCPFCFDFDDPDPDDVNAFLDFS